MDELHPEHSLEDGYAHSIQAPRGEASHGRDTGLRHGWQQSAAGIIPYDGDIRRPQPSQPPAIEAPTPDGVHDH